MSYFGECADLLDAAKRVTTRLHRTYEGLAADPTRPGVEWVGRVASTIDALIAEIERLRSIAPTPPVDITQTELSEAARLVVRTAGGPFTLNSGITVRLVDVDAFARLAKLVDDVRPARPIVAVEP